MTQKFEQVREFLRARPFRPFVIHLAGGKVVAVGHPECLNCAADGQSIGVFQQDSVTRVIFWGEVTKVEVKLDGSKRRSA